MNFEDLKDEIRMRLPLIGFIALFIFGILLIIISNKITPKKEINTTYNSLYYIDLVGETNMIMYVGDTYKEPGYKGYDVNKQDVTKDIRVNNNLNTSKIGEYDITYSLKNIKKVRKIKVVDRKLYIALIGDREVFLNVGSEYKDAGYMVIDPVDGTSIKDKVKVNNNVDTTKVGTYEIKYSVTNSKGMNGSVTRKITVIDSDFNLSINNTNYTNKNVKINLFTYDNYFEYYLLPNGKKVTNKNYSYEVSSNGTYKFILYNKHGGIKEKSITINNIDKTRPTGECSGSYKNGISNININASDNVGIDKYIVNGYTYNNNQITINKEFKTVDIIIYDKVGNTYKTSCTLTNNNTNTNTNTNTNNSNTNTNTNNNTNNNYNTNTNTNNNTNNNYNNNTNTNNNTNNNYNNNYNNNNTNTNNSNTNNGTTIYNGGSTKYLSRKVTNTISVNYYKSSYNKSFSFWLYVPINVRKKMPIVIYLPGLGERGNDYYDGTYNCVANGPIREVGKNGYNYDAIIIHAQVPYEEYVYDYLLSYKELIQVIADYYEADIFRVSIMGFSHGCYGIMNLIPQFPYNFAAAVAIGCDPKDRAKYFVNTPTWTFVGSGDGASTMPTFVNQINALGGHAWHTKVPYNAHNILSDEYSILRDNNYNVINWMISQSKK